MESALATAASEAATALSNAQGALVSSRAATAVSVQTYLGDVAKLHAVHALIASKALDGDINPFV